MLRLELRLHALRDLRFRARLAELQRHQQQQATDFLIREAQEVGFDFNLPPDQVAGLLITLTEGLLQHAAVEPERRQEYDQLFERFLTLVITAATKQRTPSTDPEPG